MATLINVVLMAALYGGALMLPLYMQTVRGQSAFISGLVLLPGALITAFLSPTSGKWYDQFGVKRLAPIGWCLWLSERLSWRRCNWIHQSGCQRSANLSANLVWLWSQCQFKPRPLIHCHLRWCLMDQRCTRRFVRSLPHLEPQL